MPTEKDLQKLKELMLEKARWSAKRRQYEHDNRIEFFGIKDPIRASEHKDCCKLFRGMNPIQGRIWEAWQDPKYKVFAMTGANRIGKCLTYQSLIDTVSGKISVGELYEQGRAFNVYAWDGQKRIIARAKAPFKKHGLHECYRITLADGQWIEAADHHRILTTSGDYATVDDLRACFSCPVRSNSEHGRQVRFSDVSHWSEKPLSFRGCCFGDSHQCDGQLQNAVNIARVFSPLQGDVRLPGDVVCNKDDQERKYKHNHRWGNGPLSNQDVLNRYVGRFAEFLYHIFGRASILFGGLHQESLQPCYAGVFDFQLDYGEELRPNYVSCSYEPPIGTYANHIISIKPIGCQEVYDFEVEKYHNYFAGGMVHHNTTKLCVVALSTLFGKWMWNGKEIVFPHKHPRKVRYIGQDWEKHIKTVVEPALKMWWPKNRKVKTSKNNFSVEALWVDEATGSSLEIMSNNQEASLHEGWEGDLILYDEPPKRDIRVANARGLVDRCGREFFGMTLLSEAWVAREVIKARNADGTPDTSVFSVDADISVNIGYGISQEGVDQFAKTLTEDQKSARLQGKPSYMSSLIYGVFDRKIHFKKYKKIPLDWIVDIIIDFHPSKPWAVLFGATSSQNFKHTIDEIWEKGSWKAIGEEIIRRINRQNLRVGNILIDPLSKGDENSDLKEESVFDKLSLFFAKYGYVLRTASKDKDGGIHMVKDLLWTENEMPALFFSEDLKRTIYEIEGYMIDPETLKPQKWDDDMMENLYRWILLDTQWTPMESEEEVISHPVKRNPITGY